MSLKIKVVFSLLFVAAVVYFCTDDIETNEEVVVSTNSNHTNQNYPGSRRGSYNSRIDGYNSVNKLQEVKAIYSSVFDEDSLLNEHNLMMSSTTKLKKNQIPEISEFIDQNSGFYENVIELTHPILDPSMKLKMREYIKEEEKEYHKELQEINTKINFYNDTLYKTANDLGYVMKILASTQKMYEFRKNKILSKIKLDSLIEQQIIINKQSKEFISQEFNFDFNE